MPVRVHVDEGCAFDVELEQRLQVVVRLSKLRVVCVHFVHFKRLGLSAVLALSVELDSPPWSVGRL